MDAARDPREELASIAASLRAYLEWQEDTGALGIPRRPKGIAAPSAAAAASPVPSHPPAAVSSAPLEHAPPEQQVAPIVGVARDAPSHAHDRSAVQTSTGLSTQDDEDRAPSAPGPAMLAPIPAKAESLDVRSLEAIAAEASSCAKCALASTRTNVVFSRGSEQAKLLFVGEAPGADEDAQGVPFVGRAGQLLDKMIGAMGLDPIKDVYIANILKCRPPNNRRPESVEVEACIPYLHEQIQAIDPRVIVALGNTAVSALLGTTLGITKVRGNWKLYRGRIPIMPTYHPSYLLRASPQQLEAKRQAWDDLQAVMKELGLKPR